MLYLNENMTNDDWIRISSVAKLKPFKTKKRNPKIEKLSLRRLNSSSSSSSSISSSLSSSSSVFSSFSTNENALNSTSKNPQKACIYKKAINKSRNFFNSSTETLSKLAYKKRKLKFNKLVDEIEIAKRSKSEKRARSKSSRDSRCLKRSTSSELNLAVTSSSQRSKPVLSSNRGRLKSVDSNNILLVNDLYTNRYNSYGLIPLIPTKYIRPSLPKHIKYKKPLIKPPSKHRIVHFRNNRSKSSPKISVFYSVEYDSPDDFTNNSIVDDLSKPSRSLINKTKFQDDEMDTLRIRAKIKPNKPKKPKELESVCNKPPSKLIIGDRPDKLKNYYQSNGSKILNDNSYFTTINSSVQSKPSNLKKNTKSVNKLINSNNLNINNSSAKTVIDNYQYDIERQISRFNQLKDIDLLATRMKNDLSDESFQRITRQNRIIFYEDKPISVNEKLVSKYEANLPHLPEELKNAITKQINESKANSMTKSPLVRKKLLFNSISKSINQDVLENLSVILEEENTHSSKNSSSVNSNSFNVSNSNIKIENNNKSDTESAKENFTTASFTKLDDDTYISERSITTITKTEMDTSRMDKASKTETLEKEKTDVCFSEKNVDQEKVKKDELISNAFKYLIAKEAEQDLKKINIHSTNKINDLIMNDEKSISCLKAESNTEIICI